MKDIIKYIKENRIVIIILVGFLMIVSIYLNDSNKIIKSIIYLLWLLLLGIDFVLENIKIRENLDKLLKSIFKVSFILFTLIVMVNCIL